MEFFILVILAVSVGAFPDVKGQCQLNPHPSVEYRCIIGTSPETRVCEAQEPVGTVVNPKCATNYYSPLSLRYMQCLSDGWSSIQKCVPECGTVSPAGEVMVVGGERVKRAELPWYAGIYRKTVTPYEQICGGSLISNRVVVSAAHCFWSDLEKQLSASRFAVAVGKLYRPWDDPRDHQAQKSDVKEIHLSPYYQGVETNFQHDIAILIVSTEFQFNIYILPVCIDFGQNFEAQQLNSQQQGKVAGWGLTAANGNPSPVLRVVELPFVEVGICFNNSPPDFYKYITGDKFCAGTIQSNTAVCKGDSGGGLVFPTSTLGVVRHYLRGVASTAPRSDGDACNTAAYTSFTQISKHEHFLKQFWIESSEANSCILPPYPEHGAYATDIAGAEPGQGYEHVSLTNITCERGYAARGSSREFSCSHGVWTGSVPRCVSICGGSLTPGNVSGYEFSDRTRHCYKLHTQGARWVDANRTCVAEGARLAVANSEDEERVLVELFARHRAEIHNATDTEWVYVGIYYQDGAWRTVDGQTLAQAGRAHWAPGQPSHEDSYPYGAMHRDGRLVNMDGSYKLAFICEM